MLWSVLALILSHAIPLIMGSNFVNQELDEGESCVLGNDGFGQCRNVNKCTTHFNRTNICGFWRNDIIACCDVIQKQCDAISLIKSAPSPIVDHIIGNAEQAAVGEFPFMALLVYSHPRMRCGASLVSDKFLLTAAHCIINKERLKPESATLGTTDIGDKGAISVGIAQSIVHDRYNATLKQNDIALIKLSAAVTRSSLVEPICLHANQDDLPVTEKLTVIGWGVTNEDHDLSDQLLKATINPISNEDCRTRFAEVQNRGAVVLTDNHLCALGEVTNGIATDTCQGDSGGPLVFTKNGKHYLTGVTSTGISCGSVHFAGVYTRVNKFLQWIIEKGAFENA